LPDKPSGKVAEAISAAAARYGIDPAVLSAVVQCESGWRPEAVSPRGAMGLMQLMPKTAGLLGVTDPFDVEQNVDAGARYLREQLRERDISGSNWTDSVETCPWRWPPTTRGRGR